MANSTKVLRGGSWYDDYWYLRCSCHCDGQPTNRNSNVGFRVVGKDRKHGK